MLGKSIKRWKTWLLLTDMGGLYPYTLNGFKMTYCIGTMYKTLGFMAFLIAIQCKLHLDQLIAFALRRQIYTLI